MLNREAAYAIIELIEKEAKFYTTVLMTYKEEGLTRFANSQIHQNVYNQDTEIKISVTQNQKTATVTTNILEPEAIKDALRKAEAILPFLPEGVAQLTELQNMDEIIQIGYDQDLNDTFGIANRAKLLSDGISKLDSEYTAAGSLSLRNMAFVWGNNRCVRRYANFTDVSMTGMVIHSTGASSYFEKSVKAMNQLDVVLEIENLYKKAENSLNPISIEPGSYDVILSPMAVGGLINFIGYLGFGSKYHDMGVSCFTDRMGETILGSNISIEDDCTNQMTMNLPFDFEGVPRTKLNLVNQGVLGNIAYDMTLAQRAGKSSTGHSVGGNNGGIPINLVMSGGQSSLEEMIKSTKKGLLVNRFHYMNIVSPREGILTALTRDGLYLVEDGKIVSPVYNLRFTDSIERILTHVELLSKEVYPVRGFFGDIVVPAIKVSEFKFTGKTQIES